MTPAAKTRKILIVDDEVDNIYYLDQALKEKYKVTTASNAEDALKIAKSEVPDLILIDIQLPKMSGLDACQALRESDVTKNINILVISGYEDQDKEFKAFHNGADDFVEKPYRLKDLLARIDAKIQKMDLTELGEQHAVKTFGNLSICKAKMECKINENPISLTTLEFNLLSFIIDNHEKVLSREKILNYVWKDVTAITKRTVDTHMVSLRKKLVGFNCDFSSIYGSGYQLVPKK
jgi:two-component system alkaline phosphatase synthesis response regulator PhoP